MVGFNELTNANTSISVNNTIIWTESSLKKIYKTSLPSTIASHNNPRHPIGNHRQQNTLTSKPKIKMGRNEFESIQLALRSRIHGKEFWVTLSDFQHEQSDALWKKDDITINLVKYVQPKNNRNLFFKDETHWPDPLLPENKVILNKNETQSFWITAYAHHTMRPGNYKGTIQISFSNQTPIEIPLDIEVWNFTLPKTPSLKSSFSIYENRIRSSYQKFHPDWWDKWENKIPEYLEIFYQQMLRYRISPNLNIDPLHLDTIYYHTQNMEKMTPAPALQFDSDILPNLINGGLSAFAIGPYAGTFGNNWPQQNKKSQQIQALIPLYRQYASELRSKSLLDKHYVYTFDEPREEHLDQVLQLTTMIHQADQDLINLVTINTTTIEDQLKYLQETDIVVFRNREFNPINANQLQALGKEVWIYVSSPNPPFPSLTIDYAASAYRILPWMCWHYELSGLLYWSVNFWKTDLYNNPDNTPWGGQYGSGALFYPGKNGPIPSIRLEILRDGFEDHDYLTLLQTWLTDQKTNNHHNNRKRDNRPERDDSIEKAKALLDLSGYIHSMSEYEKDIKAITQWRQDVGDFLSHQSSLNHYRHDIKP